MGTGPGPALPSAPRATAWAPEGFGWPVTCGGPLGGTQARRDVYQVVGGKHGAPAPPDGLFRSSQLKIDSET